MVELFCFLGIFQAWLIGWLLIRLIVGRLPVSESQLPVSFLMGLFVTAGLFFGWLCAFDGNLTYYIHCETGLLVSLSIVAIASKRVRFELPKRRTFADVFGSELFVAMFCGIIGIVGLALLGRSMLMQFGAQPFGQWDAWNIWNLKAKHLAFGEYWTWLFTMPGSHPDYPLQHPLTVARLWLFVGHDSPTGPFFIASVSTFFLLASLWTCVRLCSGRLIALLTVLCCVCSVNWLSAVGSQYADLSMSLLMVTTTAMLLICFRTEQTSRSSWLTVGLLIGAAAWMKNEGIAFAVVVTLAVMFRCALGKGKSTSLTSRLKQTRSMFAGMSVGVAIMAIQKIAFVGESDLNPTEAFTERLTDVDRYIQIAAATRDTLIQGTLWIYIAASLLLAALVGIQRDQRAIRDAIMVASIVLGMCFSYTAAYLVTPYDLDWHLTSSLDRLLVQIWPLFLIAIFLPFGQPASESQPSDNKKPATNWQIENAQ